ncbi:MAG: hypothetical protein RL701_4087 [Pseudomonadota bacterium]|jgi:hypothetical protein
MALKQRIIIGAVVLVGLLLPIVALQQVSPSGDDKEHSANASTDAAARAYADRREKVRNIAKLAETDPTEAERRARLLGMELEAAKEAARNDAFAGAAGGPSIKPIFHADPAGFGRAIVELKPALTQCYKGYGKKHKLPNDVHVKLTIGQDPLNPSRGIVTQAQTIEESFQQPAVEGCLQQAVAHMTFDPPSQPTYINLPLQLASR